MRNAESVYKPILNPLPVVARFLVAACSCIPPCFSLSEQPTLGGLSLPRARVMPVRDTTDSESGGGSESGDSDA